jgi:hypothetical protein
VAQVSSTSAIVILGSLDDEHAAWVADQVAARGRRVVWLDGQEFPGSLRIAMEPGVGGLLTPGDGSPPLAFDEIQSVYWRCYTGNGYSDLPNAEQAELAVNDSRSLLESVLIDLPVRWVNGWNGFQIHQCKPAALAHVRRLDLPASVQIPETLHTNDPTSVAPFVDRVGPCIYKPVQGGAHTRRLNEEHLTDAHLALLQHAPVTIQQEITGTDIRVFVAGERIMACELLTDALDFRDDDDLQINAIELPIEVGKACVQIARSLDLLWTGIDLRRTTPGEYYYFEANPSPMFLGFESRCDLPLTESLVDLLTFA